MYNNCENKKEKKNLIETHPSLLKEWNWEENNKLGIKPENITFGSHKKVSWICPDCNEIYNALINSRTSRNDGCPYCSGRKACLWNCLATLNPAIAAEWHPTENTILTPFNVTLKSNKKVWWLCPDCNKKYETKIEDRVNKNCNCSYCSNKKVWLENCLATLRPDIAAEWDYENNKGLTPFDVVPGSNKKVHWICSNGHEWATCISSRTKKLKPTNCPNCKMQYHENLCRKIMKEIFNKEFIKYKNKNLRNQRQLELDCYNEELKINIEYDGIQHYEYPNIFYKTEKDFINQQENDRIKDQWCRDNNILQIRVSYKYDTKEEIENYIKEQLKINNIL